MSSRLLAALAAACVIAAAPPLFAQETAPAAEPAQQEAAPETAPETGAQPGAEPNQPATDQAATPPADVSAETVVATVDGTEITIGHMIAMATRLPEQYQQLPDEVLFQGLLDQLIQQTAIGSETAGLSRRSELVLENERRGLLANQVLSAAAEAAVTDEAIQAAYEAQYANAAPTTEYNASHILVETEAEAQAIRQELEGGADFAAIAKEKSIGPAGASGGELGWFAAGTMVKPFEDAVMALEPGELSEPVQSEFGWHVIRLNETRQKEAPPLESVREEISANVQRQALEKLVADAAAAAEIERTDLEGIDPSVIRDLDLIQD